MASVLCTICARGGSKGVKNKNIKRLNGKPLIAYTIEQARESGLFEHIVISTDSDLIATVAQEYGAEVFFKRSPEMASDTAGKLEVIKDAFVRSEEHYQTTYDYLIDLDATAPLRSVQDIVESYQQFLKDDNDNLITAMPSRRSPYFNLVEVDTAGKVTLSKKLNSNVVRRQDAPKSYDMNASIYIWKRDILLNEHSIFLDKTGLYVMPEERSIDIDSELDFEFVEFLMKKHNA
jgi:CMP-N,N'-diacetyllegionaminic acid synthase